MTQLKADYPDDLRVVYRHFPLINIHDKAALATRAAEAAGQQAQFWEMHDLLYLRQNEWSSLSEDEFQTWVTDLAGEIGLDVDQFAADLSSENIKVFADQTYEEGVDIGIPGTPFLLINQRPYGGPLDYANLNSIIKLLKLQELQYTECPPLTIDQNRQYIATINTVKGDIVVELYPDAAPLAVNNFVFLARNGWYDGVTFHRVIPGTVAQAGDPSGTGFGGPGYAFQNEESDLKFDQEGLMAMANAGPDSNGSQFFFTFGPSPQWDGGYTIFGQVIDGMDIIQTLSPRDPSQNVNSPPGDEIIHIHIEER
jgi:cyclophilin family peptidyl-prolyl cis-trans isomerase